MYRAREKQMSIYDYLPPYHGELCNANRWVRLAAAIDWDGFEKAYSALFAPCLLYTSHLELCGIA